MVCGPKAPEWLGGEPGPASLPWRLLVPANGEAVRRLQLFYGTVQVPSNLQPLHKLAPSEALR